jgi:hypothetical protein
MTSIPSRVALVLAGVLVPALLMALSVSRPEYCSVVDIHGSHATVATPAAGPTPTLAPRQSLVVVQVESDRPDIKIGWADN